MKQSPKKFFCVIFMVVLLAGIFIHIPAERGDGFRGDGEAPD